MSTPRKYLHVLTVDNPEDAIKLKWVAKKVKNPYSTDIILLMQRMKEIAQNPNVAGIAATQLGRPFRLFALHIDKTKPVKFYFNPKITAESEDTSTQMEGCLSVPGKHGLVTRAKSVALKYQDQNGNTKTEVFHANDLTDGFAARAVQHEMDHLNKILYIDKCEEILTDEPKTLDEIVSGMDNKVTT